MLREHGTLADRFVNWMDLFVNVIFRNWLFGVVKRDGYDWKNEKDMVKKAVRDAGKSEDIDLKNRIFWSNYLNGIHE